MTVSLRYRFTAKSAGERIFKISQTSGEVMD